MEKVGIYEEEKLEYRNFWVMIVSIIRATANFSLELSTHQHTHLFQPCEDCYVCLHCTAKEQMLREFK